MWYKFNPYWATYEVNLTGAEPSIDEEPIGTYGMKWMDKSQSPALGKPNEAETQLFDNSSFGGRVGVGISGTSRQAIREIEPSPIGV